GAEAPVHFLAVEAGRLVGYCGLDGGDDPEMCGMVDPDRRRTGIATALLAPALAPARAHGRASVQVICEDAAPAALDWLRRLGARLDHSELRMIRPAAGAPAGGVDVELRPVETADRDALVELLAAGFPGNRDEIERHADRAAAASDEASLLALVDGEVVA